MILLKDDVRSDQCGGATGYCELINWF